MLIDTKNLSKRGQSLIESVIVLPIIISVVLAIFWFSRLILTKQQLVTAARYGTDLIVYTNFNESQVQKEIKNYLCHQKNIGRKLDAGKLHSKNIKVVINRFNIPAFTLQNIFDINGVSAIVNDVVNGLAVPLNDTSYVELRYPFKVPLFISKISGKKEIYIKARSEVLAGTGANRNK